MNFNSRSYSVLTQRRNGHSTSTPRCETCENIYRKYPEESSGSTHEFLLEGLSQDTQMTGSNQNRPIRVLPTIQDISKYINIYTLSCELTRY